MSQFYRPWPADRPKRFTGLSAALAGLAAQVARGAAPLLRRFPGWIFLAGLALACGLAFVVARQVQAGASQRGAASIFDPQSWLGLALLRDLLGLLGVITFVSVLAMFAIWWERKVSAFIQCRMGPMRVGGWHGWSQSLADGIKLLSKEDLIPADADRPLFRLAPYLAFVPAVTAFIALPFGGLWVARDVDFSLLLLLALLEIEILGVLIAGWASNNKWSVYGAIREACQVVSYEVPMGLALLAPVTVVGSLRLTDFAAHQSGGWSHWLAWHSPWMLAAMGVYFVASLAACKRAPFDLPEAESELVAGFHTEYSGFRWSLFFFAEYAAMFIVSGLCVLLFLGGWDAPWSNLAPASWVASSRANHQILMGLLFSGPIWFIAKCLLLVFVQMWLRWTLPRLRIDQVLYSCVQVIIPLAFVLLIVHLLWEYAAANWPVFGGIAQAVRVILATAGAAGLAYLAGVAIVARRRGRAMVGPYAVERPLAGG